MDNSVGGGIATRAPPGLADERLGEPLRQPLTNQPGAEIAPPPSGKTHNQAQRPRRVGLRPPDLRDRRERGGSLPDSHGPISRARRSPPPPAANPTIKRTGRDG